MPVKKSETYLNRSIDPILLDWKTSLDRKPLLLRGARQVGKSSAIRALSAHFEYYVEVNFEENRSIHTLFAGDLNPQQICENLSAVLNVPIIAGKTLLFFDEIQACLPAISALRFFYEKMPDLHVVAAGSLLEFALDELPSYGVGRVRSLFVYPFSFDEFLLAIGEVHLLKMKQNAHVHAPIQSILHEKLLDLFKKFLLVGGMPEAVLKYVQGRGLLEVQLVLDDLLVSVKADFAKYKKKVPSLRVLEVFESVAMQMGGKFVYTKAVTEAKLVQIKEAVNLLIMAGLVIPVTHSAANGIPVGAESDHKKRKMLLYDTGIFQRILGLNLSDIILSADFNSINKGALVELCIGLELLKYSNPYHSENLYYWHRETASSNAEVDYVYQKDTEILPIEVKAVHSGAMQSMYQFLKEKQRNKGIRFSFENFGSVDGVDIYPVYAVQNFVNSV